MYLQPRSSDGFQFTSRSIYRGHTSSFENVMREAVKNLAKVKINNTLCIPFIHWPSNLTVERCIIQSIKFLLSFFLLNYTKLEYFMIHFYLLHSYNLTVLFKFYFSVLKTVTRLVLVVAMTGMLKTDLMLHSLYWKCLLGFFVSLLTATSEIVSFKAS